MSERRDEILRATAAAAKVLRDFPVGVRSSFDIVGAVTALEIPLVFRRLEGLLGATIAIDDDLRGVLITTARDLAVQRFTLAHELGHILLGHETSLDQDIDVSGRFTPHAQPIQEVAANTFASELLAPRRLMLETCQRHAWNSQALSNPANVYQLALRLGISFQATCWALLGHKAINRLAIHSLRGQAVKELKLALIPERHFPNPWANAWNLSGEDTGTVIEAGSEDVFAITFADNASAGYLWELVDAGAADILDETISASKTQCGGPARRELILRFNTLGQHRLTFEHRRPWNKQRVAHIEIQIQNYGKEQSGFARRARESALAGAGA